MRAQLHRLFARVRALFTGEELDRDFEQELESHVAMLTDENVRCGMSVEEAQRAARLRTGASAALKEEHRDARGLPTVESLLQDLRFAFRLLTRERWSSAAAILTLALGIGANAVGFTIVNAAFLRGLPFDESERLYMLTWQGRSDRTTELSRIEFDEARKETRTLDLAAYLEATMNVSDERTRPEQVWACSVSANAFDILRQKPLVGRDFSEEDARPGSEPTVILGYDIWKNRYGSDPGTLGRTLRLNGRPATIIGVMPERMKFPENSQLWALLPPRDTHASVAAQALSVIGRLRGDADVKQAHAELSSIGSRLKAADPEAAKNFGGAHLETLTEAFVGGHSRTMFVTVMGAVVFVLLIACANVANLLLSRSASRAREIALRMSIGATRGRVVRQLLIESLVLGVIGGTFGLLLASFGVQAFEAAMQASEKPYWIVFTLDRVVFAYVAAICVLTAVLFGLAPALHVSRTNGHEVLKEGGRGFTGTRRVRWFSNAMVVGQLASTVVLLAGAGYMVRSFIALYSVDIGVDTERLMAMQMELPETKYPSAASRRLFFAQIEDRIAGLPGVEGAAVTTGVPPFDGGERLMEVEPIGGGAKNEATWVSTVAISPKFFGVLSRPILRGRDFSPSDGDAGTETVIVNEETAALFFSGEEPIGRRIRFTQRNAPQNAPLDPWRTIVGISAPIRHGSKQDSYRSSVIYVPYRQHAAATASLLVRSGSSPATIMAAVSREVQAVDRDQPVLEVRTLQQILDADRWPYRVFGALFAILAAIALILSAVGLYGVIAYSVTQRTQEIGVRVAVGAQRLDVSWLILKSGLFQLAIGLPLGIVGALGLGVILERILVNAPSADPVSLSVVTLVLSAVSVAACLLPAWRATQVDPVVALRAD